MLNIFPASWFAIIFVIAFSSAALAMLPPPVSFAIIRGNERIGEHTVRFAQRGENLIVDIAITIKVRFAFMTVYHYEHENREVWRNNRLISLTSKTNDNGARFAVTARATSSGLEVQNQTGTTILPGETISTSYWNVATVKQTKLLDSQSGKLLNVTIEPAGDGSVAEQTYTMSGDLDGEISYAPDGRWVKLAFTSRGAQIRYNLITE